jgi:hypothetical protein
MKKLSALFALAVLLPAGHAALPQPDLLAQIHFAGARKISDNPVSAAFTNEFCSPEALALRAQTADKLSVWISVWLQKQLGVAATDGAAKLRPLLDDLQKQEWFFEARVAPNGRTEFAMAVKSDAAIASRWQNNLKPFFPASSFRTVAGWLIFDSDPARLKLGDDLAQKISAPPAAWLDADINWPRLAPWFPKLKELALPETQFSITAPNANFHISGKCLFPDKLSIALDPWRVPTNTIHPPLDSFTVVRGIASWLKSQSWAKPYELSPAPNQLTTWSLPFFPFQDFAAIPVPDARKALADAYAQVAPEIDKANARDYFMMPVHLEMTNNRLLFGGIPFVAPALKSLQEPAGQFLLWEMFPNTPRGAALPPELLRHLEKPNLVFYHWENSSQRMSNLLQCTQFALLITRHKQLGANSAAFKWLKAVELALGPTDMEISQSGPSELTFERKAPGIFTATEFYALANWFEATNFPGCDLKLPPAAPHSPRQNKPFQLTSPATPGVK